MFCEKCGGQIPDKSKFCRWCGEEVKPEVYPKEEPESTDGATPNQNRGKYGIVIVLVVLVAAVIIGVAIFHTANNGVGADTDTKEENQISYEDLSGDEKRIIDFIYENKDTWQSVHDSSQTFNCTYVCFTTSENKCVFYSGYRSANGVFKSWYFFDPDSGVFEKMDGAYYYGGLSSENFDTGWGEEKQKNILAQEYISYLNSTEE